MSAIIEFGEDVIVGIGDGFADFGKEVWKTVALPILEDMFGIFGIEDEYVLTAHHISTKLLDNGSDHYDTAVKRAALANTRNDATFFQNYYYETSRNKVQVRSQYMYVANGAYTSSAPQMVISGGSVNNTDVNTYLNVAVGGSNTILSSNSYVPTPEIYFKDSLQGSPEFYMPGTNTLTYSNQYGESFSDWELDSVEFNETDLDYDITISRSAEHAVFWVEGQSKIVEGDSATYTIKCNRQIPTGSTCTISVSFSGTAVDGVDYTSVTSADMLQNTSEIDIVVPITENGSSDGNKTLVIAIDSVDNTSHIFESLEISPTENSFETSIVDDDSLMLTVSNVSVSEDAVSVTVPVKSETTSSAFTVDFVLTNITATKGVDYENISGTLSFSGAAGEEQDVVVGITADIADDDYEQFEISFTNCSDPSIDISQTCIVTIIDGTDAKYFPGNKTDTVVFSRPDYTKERTLIVRYHNNSDSPSDWYYWLYAYSDGTYPDLGETGSKLSGLELLPVLPIRVDKSNIDSDKQSQEYLKTKYLLNTMGIPLDDLLTSLDSNESIDDVDDVLVNFCICPSDTEKSLSKMMYLMWYEIIVSRGISSNINKYSAEYVVDDLIKNGIGWTDHSITYGVYDSTPHVIGSYRHEISGENLVLYKQTAENQATVILIENLKSMSAITSVISDQEYHKVAVNSVEDDNFVIPVSWYMFNQLSHREIMEAFPAILRIDSYAATITKVDWYATEDFKLFLQIAQIALVIFFWWTGAGTWTELGIQILTQYALRQIVFFGIETVYRITGDENLATAAGIVGAIFVTGFASDFSGFTDPLQLLIASTNFVDNVGHIQNLVGQDIASDIAEYDDLLEEREQEIEEAQKSVNNILDAEFVDYLNSPTTDYLKAISLQYNYDYMYNYDNLVQDHYDTQLRIGII